MKKRLLTIVLTLVMCLSLTGTGLASGEQAQETVIHVSNPNLTSESLHYLKDDANEFSGTILEPRNLRIVLEGKDYTTNWLNLQNFENVTIEGTTGTRILCTSATDTVISAMSCKRLTLKNIVLGHELLPTEDDCMQGVLQIGNSEVILQNCDIFGCGWEGIHSWNSSIKAYNTVIRDCSKKIMSLSSDCNALFQNCIFSGNGYKDPGQYGVEVGSNIDLTFADCIFVDNENPNFYGGYNFKTATVAYDTSTFYHNAWGNDNVDVRPEIAAPPSSETPATSTPTQVTDDHVYDTPDLSEDMDLPAEELDNVSDEDSAVETVEKLTESMTADQKINPQPASTLATLYAETAAAKAASMEVSGSNIVIDNAAVGRLSETAAQASAAVEAALNQGGVTTVRDLSSTVTVLADTTDFTIQINPDILTTGIDKVCVETADCAITFKLADLSADLTETLTFNVHISEVNSNARSNSEAEVDISMPRGKLTNPVTVSLPNGKGDNTYKAVVNANGSATASKYNPATTKMDGKVSASGTYKVATNQKDFTDIANKSAEMQKAIRYLASKGIIAGKTSTAFEPNGSINRAEIATLLVKALGKLDSSATASFSDVTKSNWYYTAAASSQKRGLIKGFEDQTFRGTTNINKVQIVAVSSRVLTTEMRYKTPSDPQTYLSKYSDSVSNWAKPEVALATRENLVLSRKDGTFSGDKNMTRGDAAIVIYRLFQRIW